MLELSPFETAANASASSIPASISTSRSKPIPTMVRPVKFGLSRRKASADWSMIATVWPRFSRPRASVDPTRPQPMMTTCTPLITPCPAWGRWHRFGRDRRYTGSRRRL